MSCDKTTSHLCFFLDYVYFTDWRLGAIVRVRKTDGGEMTVIRRGISNIMHVKSYDDNIQIGEWGRCALLCGWVYLVWWLLFSLSTCY